MDTSHYFPEFWSKTLVLYRLGHYSIETLSSESRDKIGQWESFLSWRRGYIRDVGEEGFTSEDLQLGL